MGCELPDTQNKIDARNITINRVGVKNIRHPMIFVDKQQNNQSTIGIFTMTVELPKEIKGTHMSRFIEILNEETPTFSVDSFAQLLERISGKLTADCAQMKVKFTFFRNKEAPVSKTMSMMDYQVGITSTLRHHQFEQRLNLVVPVTSLCPCSKSISKYGAHNQRSHITMNVLQYNQHSLFFEDLIDIAEQCASSDLYAVLKREDEKNVTERAYENPVFVEDMVRDMAIELNNHDSVAAYQIESENFESIHNHSAYARIEKDKR